MAMPKDERGPTTVEIHDLPIIDLPFTRLTEHWFTHQYGPCKDFQMDYVRCAGRVGAKHETTKCKEYLDDWMECAFKVKTAKRYAAMQKERKAQGIPFKKPPPPDSMDIPIY